MNRVESPSHSSCSEEERATVLKAFQSEEKECWKIVAGFLAAILGTFAWSALISWTLYGLFCL